MSNIVKKLTSIILCMLVIFQLMSLSVMASDTPVDSDLPIKEKIFDYVISSLGVIKRGVDSMISIGGDPFSNWLKDKINQSYGEDGIYLDGDGNYIFSNRFTQDVLNKLQESNGYKYRIIDNFNYYDNLIGSPYTTTGYASKYADLISLGVNEFENKFLIVVYQKYNPNAPARESRVYTKAYLYDMRNVVSICLENVSHSQTYYYWFHLKDKNNNNLWVKTYEFTDSILGNGTMSTDSIYSTTEYTVEFFNSTTDNMIYVNDVFNSFPYRQQNTTSGGFNLFNGFSHNSILLFKDVTSYNAYINDDGLNKIYYDNSINIINPVSQTVLQNNNWNTIYNNQVKIINKNYIEDGGKTLTKEQVQKIISKQTVKVTEAIENGVENIEESISVSNAYLEKISSNTSDIINILNDMIGVIQDNTSGGTEGAACLWSENDIENVKTTLSNLYKTTVSNDQDI